MTCVGNVILLYQYINSEFAHNIQNNENCFNTIYFVLYWLQELVVEKFLEGDAQTFWLVWKENIPKSFLEASDVQRLEFLLRLYFAVAPMITNEVGGFCRNTLLLMAIRS